MIKTPKMQNAFKVCAVAICYAYRCLLVAVKACYSALPENNLCNNTTEWQEEGVCVVQSKAKASMLQLHVLCCYRHKARGMAAVSRIELEHSEHLPQRFPPPHKWSFTDLS